MVQINMAAREITVKVVYYGPALSGKTTNLQQLHALLDPDARGKMVTLDTADDRTLYFDFLPIQFGTAERLLGQDQALHRARPGDAQVHAQGRARGRRRGRLHRRFAARVGERQRLLVARHGGEPARRTASTSTQIPKVVQFNKRDLPDVKPLRRDQQAVGRRPDLPGRRDPGEGVLETFRELLRRAVPRTRREARLRRQVRRVRGGLPQGVFRHFARAEAKSVAG